MEMIVYAFWHAPRAGVDAAVYAARLVRFQEELERATSGVTGLGQDPAAYRMAEVPWLNPAPQAYLDLYVLPTTTEMQYLNQAAVSGDRTEPHRLIAELAGPGAGSLYEEWLGTVKASGMKHGYWFSKPAGMSYAQLKNLLADLENKAAVLRRMMVLGPSPEFWVLSQDPVDLPDAIGGTEHRALTAI